MSKCFMVSCPYCNAGNSLSLDDYEYYVQGDGLDLKDICDLCGNEYGFDLEVKYITSAYEN